MLQYQEKISNRVTDRTLFKRAKLRILNNFFLLVFIIGIFISCSDNRYDSQSGYYGDAAADKVLSEEASATFMDRSAGAPEMKMAAVQALPAAGEQIQPASERKKILSGGCTIQTASPSEKIIEAGIIAQGFQGWIESSSDTGAAVRVPSKNFRAAFSELLKLGIVIDKYETADDVTDYYADLTARLEILGRTRLRLERILLSEKDTEKKIPILREMKRIDDQIDSIRARLESLEKNISYSLIEITFIPFTYDYQEGKEGFFPWIASLDPFNATITDLNRRIVIALPEDFAILKGSGIRYFHAETADGTVLRIGSMKNKPEGNGIFWQKAINYGLGSKFAEASEGETGNLKYNIFKSRGIEEFHYLAGTLNRRKLLYIVEIYFPDIKSHEKRIGELLDSLGRLEIK